MPRGYPKTATTVYLMNYHFAWSPKYRRKVLTGKLAERLEQLIYEKAQQLGCRIIQLRIMPDHVHLFIEGYPKLSPNRIIGKTKGYTSRVLRREFPELLKMPALWTRSYFVSTAGRKGRRVQVIKTVKIPVHCATTKRKLNVLEKLTARLTLGVVLWSNLIENHTIRTRSKLRSRILEKKIKEQTGLSAGFVQCCGDIALWMWRSYEEQYRMWLRKLKIAEKRGDEIWVKKLLKREPSQPFTNGNNRKVPIWFDYRIGRLEKAKTVKMASYVVRIATLKKGEWITVLLNPARYHLDSLEKGAIKSFQIIKKGSKFYVHVKVEYEVPEKLISGVLGVDLGVRRSAATVLLKPNERLTARSYLTVRDGEKKKRLDQLNRQVSELQHAKKYKTLKRLRHTGKRVAEYFDRLFAKRLASLSEGCLLVVGYPKGIKYENFKGNRKRRLRKLLTRWSYSRIVKYIVEERTEKGAPIEVVSERWSSRTCWKCGSRKTERINQSTLWCWNCCKYFHADYNGALNIGLPFLAKAADRGATVELAQTEDEQAREIVACKLGSQHPSGVGSSHMYASGEISAGKASETLGIPRVTFYQLLKEKGIPLPKNLEESIKRELKNLKQQ